MGIQIRALVLLTTILSCNNGKAQEYVSTDSLTKLFYRFNDTTNICLKSDDQTPCNWFKLRNTKLGLVIYERDNKPFNIQFLSQDTLFYNDWFEFYHYVIDSTGNNGNQFNIYCHDTVAWGDIKVHFQFKMVDENNSIYSLTSTLYRINDENVEYLSRDRMLGLFIPYRKNRNYFILREPNPKSFESEINFLKMDKQKMELYKH